MRLSFIGGFGRPGYFTVDPSTPLGDAINGAGGVGAGGKQDKITVHRGKSEIMDEKRVAAAIRDGETVENLGLQSGDEVRVPLARQGRTGLPRYQVVLFSIIAFGAILGLIRSAYTP